MCSVKHPEKGVITSVEEGHDVQVAMSAMVQLARDIDDSAPHVIVYGIMVSHPTTSSRDKLHMTSR